MAGWDVGRDPSRLGEDLHHHLDVFGADVAVRRARELVDLRGEGLLVASAVDAALFDLLDEEAELACGGRRGVWDMGCGDMGSRDREAQNSPNWSSPSLLWSTSMMICSSFSRFGWYLK